MRPAVAAHGLAELQVRPPPGTPSLSWTASTLRSLPEAPTSWWSPPRRATSRTNTANPLAPWIYGVSTMHCMTVSLAKGGAGLGTAWGEQRARQMLAHAGFVDVAIHDAPGDPLNSIYVATRSSGAS